MEYKRKERRKGKERKREKEGKRGQRVVDCNALEGILKIAAHFLSKQMCILTSQVGT